jgi:hypothetical protein
MALLDTNTHVTILPCPMRKGAGFSDGQSAKFPWIYGLLAAVMYTEEQAELTMGMKKKNASSFSNSTS